MNEKVTSIPELFGSMVFTQEQMRQRLPAHIYDAWQQCLVQGTSLDRSIADEIAAAMKEWAIEKGATHYTHWFQQTILLPENVEKDKISAKVEHGILSIEIPKKKEEEKQKTFKAIEVK